jgi:Protein of unknown function (DUF3500)
MKNFFILLFSIIFFQSSHAQNTQNSSAGSLAAAKAFLATLDKDQLAKVSFPYESEERSNWYFIPKERNGLWLKSMTDAQRVAAMNLLKSTLSEQGQEKAIAIMQLEIILKELENIPNSERRDPLKFYFTIFGTPDAKKFWGWRVEGHHLSLNFTSENNKVVSGTPLFLGNNPAIVPNGEKKGYQILKDEANFAFELLNSFDEKQLRRAILSPVAPNDMITFNSRKFGMLPADGIAYSDMTKDQQVQLMRLISLYVKNYPFGFANEFMQKIEKAGLDKLHFVWMGDKQWGGKGHYYRIQNDVLLIEYDNTQNNANHVHTVVRDFTNDFGEDMLRRHYELEHAKK